MMVDGASCTLKTEQVYKPVNKDNYEQDGKKVEIGNPQPRKTVERLKLGLVTNMEIE